MSTKGRATAAIIAMALAIMILAAGGAAAVAQKLDPALLEARRQKSNPSFSVLSYRHLDELFDTRPVTTGDSTWALPRSPLSLADDAAVEIRGRQTTIADAMQALRISALLVMKDGKIVKEIHRNGGNDTSRYAGYSMSKSWISMLFGIVQGQGKIGALEDLVTKHLPELKGTAYETVTLRNLLTMRAGTSWVENYSAGSFLDKVREGSTNAETMYYEDAAREVRSVAAPGTAFNYSTLDTELVGKIIAGATGKSIAQLMTDTIWRPAGMEAPGYWIMQGPSGRQHEWYGAGFAATVRDFGRLGQLMLDGGRANGRQIVPRAWVEESTRATSGDNRYFYLWWGIPGVDGFAANGFGGQHVYIDRATRTVMVLMSYGGGDGAADLFTSVVKRLSQP